MAFAGYHLCKPLHVALQVILSRYWRRRSAPHLEEAVSLCRSHGQWPSHVTGGVSTVPILQEVWIPGFVVSNLSQKVSTTRTPVLPDLMIRSGCYEA